MSIRMESDISSRNAILHQQEPVPSTSKQSVFSPESLRPYPKAPPRKIEKTNRKTKKSTIYTDTPEKEAIRKEYEERQEMLKKKQTKKKVIQPSTGSTNKEKWKGKVKKRNTNASPESSEEEEYYCLLCLEMYSATRPGESWIQCQGGCKQWPHVACTDGSRYYVCHNCDESD